MSLEQRAIACKGWRWMPGMRATIPDAPGNARIVSIDEVAIKGGWSDVRWDYDSWTYGHPRPCLPDLTDPATLGCLLALVREAWGIHHLTTCAGGERDGSISWEVESIDPRDFSGYHQHVNPCKTEAEALVFALEAAP